MTYDSFNFLTETD